MSNASLAASFGRPFIYPTFAALSTSNHPSSPTGTVSLGTGFNVQPAANSFDTIFGRSSTQSNPNGDPLVGGRVNFPQGLNGFGPSTTNTVTQGGFVGNPIIIWGNGSKGWFEENQLVDTGPPVTRFGPNGWFPENGLVDPGPPIIRFGP